MLTNHNSLYLSFLVPQNPKTRQFQHMRQPPLPKWKDACWSWVQRRRLQSTIRGRECIFVLIRSFRMKYRHSNWISVAVYVTEFPSTSKPASSATPSYAFHAKRWLYAIARSNKGKPNRQKAAFFTKSNALCAPETPSWAWCELETVRSFTGCRMCLSRIGVGRRCRWVIVGQMRVEEDARMAARERRWLYSSY